MPTNVILSLLDDLLFYLSNHYDDEAIRLRKEVAAYRNELMQQRGLDPTRSVPPRHRKLTAASGAKGAKQTSIDSSLGTLKSEDAPDAVGGASGGGVDASDSASGGGENASSSISGGGEDAAGGAGGGAVKDD